MGLRQADRVEAVLQLVLEELQPLVQAAGLKSLDIASDPKVGAAPQETVMQMSTQQGISFHEILRFRGL